MRNFTIRIKKSKLDITKEFFENGYGIIIIHYHMTRSYSVGIIDNFTKNLTKLVFDNKEITQYFVEHTTKEKIEEVRNRVKRFQKLDINTLFRKIMALEKSQFETESIWLL